MARTYGKLTFEDGRWKVAASPQAMIRLKRWFERIYKGSKGFALLSDTPDNARDLQVFLERYPMEADAFVLGRLDRQADAHRERESAIEHVLRDGYVAGHVFELALPPREYQKQAAELLLRTGRLLLADDVGVGKTASAICALTDPRTLPALVVTLTHLPRQWEAEIKRFAPSLRTHVLRNGKPYPLDHVEKGRTEGQLPLTNVFPDVVITSYSKLASWGDALAGKVKTLILDECQELRHQKTGQYPSQKYRAADQISALCHFRMGLSATPFVNRGGELHSVVSVLAPDALGTVEEFGREWCKSGSYGEKAEIADPKAFGLYMRDQGLMLRRTRKDVGRELPALSTVLHPIETDLAPIQAAEDAAAELARIILTQGGRGWDKMQASEELDSKLRQATGIAKAAYVAEFVKLLVENGENVLVYAWHRSVYEILDSKLGHLKPAYFTGAESAKQKEESKRRFISGETPVLIMSLRAGAGLDGLQFCCRNVVVAELEWAWGILVQAIGRVYRDGQPDPVVVYYLLAEIGTDPIMMDVLDLKRRQLEGVVDPHAALVEKLKVRTDHVKLLARDILRRRATAPRAALG